MKSKNQQRRLRKKQAKEASAENGKDSKNKFQEWYSVPQLNIENKESSDLMEKLNKVKENDQFKNMLPQLSKRFRTQEDETHSDDKEGQMDNGEGADYSEEIPVSRKQMRLQQKPLLSDLKKNTNKPEMIEWFDADATYPEVLVKFKTFRNSVHVPVNWRQRSEIPQFSGKPQYELPRNIQETGIIEQRELSFKSKRLDADYEKMYDAFFSEKGRELAEPSRLLGFGKIAELHYKPRPYTPGSKSSQSTPIRPKTLSPGLMKALGLKKGDPSPWEPIIEKYGEAPGYRQREQIKLWGSF